MDGELLFQHRRLFGDQVPVIFSRSFSQNSFAEKPANPLTGNGFAISGKSISENRKMCYDRTISI
ncbi:MAG: hypothetical protein WBI76_08180 [Dethiobacteria bacterium]